MEKNLECFAQDCPYSSYKSKHGKEGIPGRPGKAFAVCFDLGHMAKNASLSCVKSRGTRQRFSHRQSPSLVFFCRVSRFTHGKTFAACPTKKTHGKEVVVGPLLCANTLFTCISLL